MKSIDNKIHIVENFISQETAKFLVDTIGPTTVEAPDPSIFGGPMLGLELKEFTTESKISWQFEKNNNNNNISLDIFTMLIHMMTKTISDFYKKEYSPIQVFYSKMITGGKNDYHFDNYMTEHSEETGEFELNERPFAKNDRSGLLYLNEEYSGGELIFPNQDLRLKPKPGTFIFFEGDDSVPHEVTTVESGERHNIISFYGLKDDLEIRIEDAISKDKTRLKYL